MTKKLKPSNRCVCGHRSQTHMGNVNFCTVYQCLCESYRDSGPTIRTADMFGVVFKTPRDIKYMVMTKHAERIKDIIAESADEFVETILVQSIGQMKNRVEITQVDTEGNNVS